MPFAFTVEIFDVFKIVCAAVTSVSLIWLAVSVRRSAGRSRR